MQVDDDLIIYRYNRLRTNIKLFYLPRTTKPVPSIPPSLRVWQKNEKFRNKKKPRVPTSDTPRPSSVRIRRWSY
jgi:hypothetical protein